MGPDGLNIRTSYRNWREQGTEQGKNLVSDDEERRNWFTWTRVRQTALRSNYLTRAARLRMRMRHGFRIELTAMHQLEFKERERGTQTD